MKSATTQGDSKKEPAKSARRTPAFVTPEKALFIEEQTAALYAYIIESLDRARAEGNNILQWIFATVVGGLALTGSLFAASYWQFAVGPFFAAGWAAFVGFHLLNGMHAQTTRPPGNRAESLLPLIHHPLAVMRISVATGLDARITENTALCGYLAGAVDKARRQFAWLPVVFLAGIGVGWAVCALFRLWQFVFTARS
jgi:hypothetical protein